MGILKNIEWVDTSSNLIVYKFPVTRDQINKGSVLTVRESTAWRRLSNRTFIL